MPEKCSKCGVEIVWLKNKTTAKPAPIEAARNENGNILVKGGLYRVATKEEIEKARVINHPLYLNHFAGCEFAKNFRKEK